VNAPEIVVVLYEVLSLETAAGFTTDAVTEL
jgi:hypothetical protein